MMPDLAGNQLVIEILYLIASVLFILSLKWMSSPTSARHGIWAGEAGMLLAIEGPNEPNNFPIVYNGRQGGGPAMNWLKSTTRRPASA